MLEQDVRNRARQLLAEVDPAGTDRVTFRRARFDRGLAWVHFPTGLGGLGLSASLNAVVEDELSRNHGTTHPDPSEGLIGLAISAPTLLAHAAEDVKAHLLRRIYTGEDVWCQLFSEPGAGSDLAGLACSAVRDGDSWIVNGQKVWSSFAHVASWGKLLVRTDPDVPKHQGLTYFYLDMHSPGVEVRPLYQITGEAEFNEVFLDDVRIPCEQMLGPEGSGWSVALTTLMNERAAIGNQASQDPAASPTGILLDLWRNRTTPRDASEDAVLRDEVVKRYVEAESLRLTSKRAAARRFAGTPGPEGSVTKLAMSEIHQRVWETALEVLDAEALVYEPAFEHRRPDPHDHDQPDRFAKWAFLRSRAHTIEGGTSQVMRNILGERVLGLPAEPRADADCAWKDVPR